jgi:hypothetical protein
MGRWTRVAAVVLPLLALALLAAPSAAAASGDLIRTVHPPDTTTGVSVAFDGHYLYYTNDGEAVLHRIAPNGDPATHLDVPIVGAPGIAAFSYDATRDKFWAVDSESTGGTGKTIYLLDKSGVATPAFTVGAQVAAYRNCDNTPPFPGCPDRVDGIAYDAEHDTVWYSPDESSRVYEFEAREPNNVTSLTGQLVDFFDVNDTNPQTGVNESFAAKCGKFDFGDPFGLVPENFNSGVAASAGHLYLGSPDCSPPTFFDYSKNPAYCPNPGNNAALALIACAPPSKPCLDPDPTIADSPAAAICPGHQIASYLYNASRPEDIECDDVTFSVDVMWIRDELDGTMQAYQVPTGTCIFGGGIRVQPTKSRMTGGGYIAGLSGTAYHGFMLHCDTNVLPNRLQVSWGNGMHFHMISSSTATCDKSLTSSTMNHIHGTGVGRLNGMPNYQVEWDFTDNGEPGNTDQGSITIKNPAGVPMYSWSSNLLGGNYQMHVAQ